VRLSSVDVFVVYALHLVGHSKPPEPVSLLRSWHKMTFMFNNNIIKNDHD